MSETTEKTRKQQLQEELAMLEQEEKQSKADQKKCYEEERDAAVQSLCKNAKEINLILESFKKDCQQVFQEQEERLNEYGGLRGNSKGGFQLVHSSGVLKAKRSRSTKPVWDERSTKAMELLHDFLHDTVKKTDQSLFEILLSFIEKNAEGQLEYARVMNLLQHKDKYQDERWVKGLELIQESYSNELLGYGYEFFSKNQEGNWNKIEINFTAIKMNALDEVIEVID
jgi:hypothetical protein